MTALLLPLQLTLLVAGAIASLVAVALAWVHRREPGGMTLLLLLLAITEWQIASALGALGSTGAQKLWWSQVEYVGVVSVAPLWLLFVRRYLGTPIGGGWRLALWIVPAITFVAGGDERAAIVVQRRAVGGEPLVHRGGGRRPRHRSYPAGVRHHGHLRRRRHRRPRPARAVPRTPVAQPAAVIPAAVQGALAKSRVPYWPSRSRVTRITLKRLKLQPHVA